MFTSHLSSAAAGFFLASLLSSLLLILLGDGGTTVSIWLDICLVVTGVLIAGAAYTSRKRLPRRKQVRPTFVVPELLSDRMRRDIGLDNL